MKIVWLILRFGGLFQNAWGEGIIPSLEPGFGGWFLTN